MPLLLFEPTLRCAEHCRGVNFWVRGYCVCYYSTTVRLLFVGRVRRRGRECLRGHLPRRCAHQQRSAATAARLPAAILFELSLLESRLPKGVMHQLAQHGPGVRLQVWWCTNGRRDQLFADSLPCPADFPEPRMPLADGRGRADHAGGSPGARCSSALKALVPVPRRLLLVFPTSCRRLNGDSAGESPVSVVRSGCAATSSWRATGASHAHRGDDVAGGWRATRG